MVECRTLRSGWCGILCFAALLSACSTPPPPTIAPRELKILYPEGTGVSADNGIGQVASALSQEGLTQLASDGRYQLRLAESLKWSDDGRELVVTLKPGILMHDGTTLTASIAATILGTLDRTAYPGLADVEHVTTEGDRTLRFALRRHAAWLPEDLSAPLAVRIDPSNPKSLKYGTGPYQVISRDDASLVLKRFTSYNGGVPGIDRVTVRSAPTLRTAWASLLRGEVDMVTDLPPDSVELVRNENIRIITFARNYFYLIAFNGRSPKFADPRIRRALNIAIDRDSIVRKILKGSGFPASGPLWPKHWAYDASVGSFAFDPHQAATLLDAAKLPIHESRDTSLPPARLRITCMIPSQFSILEQIALDVQRQLSEVGVDIHFDVQPFESYEARLKAGDFETVMVDLTSGPSLSRSSIMWRSPKRSDALRIFNYDNPVTEALFENLRTAPNDVVTRSEVRRLQQAFLESPPAIFLAWNERARAIRSEFRVDVEAGADPISTLWRWQTDKTIGSNTPMASR